MSCLRCTCLIETDEPFMLESLSQQGLHVKWVSTEGQGCSFCAAARRLRLSRVVLHWDNGQELVAAHRVLHNHEKCEGC